jgi:hypothetical protein
MNSRIKNSLYGILLGVEVISPAGAMIPDGNGGHIYCMKRRPRENWAGSQLPVLRPADLRQFSVIPIATQEIADRLCLLANQISGLLRSLLPGLDPVVQDGVESVWCDLRDLEARLVTATRAQESAGRPLPLVGDARDFREDVDRICQTAQLTIQLLDSFFIGGGAPPRQFAFRPALPPVSNS